MYGTAASQHRRREIKIAREGHWLWADRLPVFVLCFLSRNVHEEERVISRADFRNCRTFWRRRRENDLHKLNVHEDNRVKDLLWVAEALALSDQLRMGTFCYIFHVFHARFTTQEFNST